MVKRQTNALAPNSAFPVVAVGASAGGLAAFTSLLKALPSNTGMAFVFVQHLEPSHQSALAGLLSKTTTMPVVEVSDGVAVEPNHVYVIPPNKNMTIRDGALRLAPRPEISGPQRPIDDFSIALADEKGSGAIGVVLSGTGSDGTYGLKAIKAAGGVTFAQEPKTAQWPAMPISAITAGSVDFVLSLRRIAAELARIGHHPYVADARDVPDGSDLDKVCQILRAAVGIDFRLYKPATLRRRIARRMALQKVASLAKYGQTLKQNPEEAQALADDVFIHVTSFFRDPECFLALRKQVLAKLYPKTTPLKTTKYQPAPDDPFRIWVAGCSTGEEVYSIAMALLEELGDRAGHVRIQIFGTDIQERAVEHARSGIYTEAAVAGVSPARLKRFFTQTDHGYQIQKFVRDLCVFSRHDLAKDPPFSRLDLVSCRNVLIYMGPALQKRILSVFQYALKPGGFLFLGNSESISDYSDVFTVSDQKHRIFARKVSTSAYRDLTPASARGLEPGEIPPKAALPAPGADFRREAEGALLEHYAPPALIVDPELHIVHFQGDTSPYLAPATGQPSFHLLKMVRPELVVDLRTAIHKARRDSLPAAKDNVQFEHRGHPAAVRLEVRPLARRNDRKADLLVVFQKREPPPTPDAASRKIPAGKAEKLERELAATRENLRSLIAEHETAQEEMKAANEEILSSNEELQSTNEELETAKEELQSSNEELITLNDELQHRNVELSVLSQDLSNLLSGVDVPVLVLDGALRVRRFTPMAGALLNLIPGDVGRPFSDIASTLDVPDWDELFAKVTEHGQTVERDVKVRSGHRFSMRVRPYKTGTNEIDGVLVVLFDMDAILRTVEVARESRDQALRAEARAEAVLNSLTSHVAVIDSEGRILATNDAWNRFALDNGLPSLSAGCEGANYLEICRRAEASGLQDGAAARAGVEEVLAGRKTTFQMVYACHSPSAERRWFQMTVSPLKGTKRGAAIAHSNITARKVAELEALKSASTIRAMMEATTQGIVAVDERETIVIANANAAIMFGYGPDELIGRPLGMLIPDVARGRHAGHHKAYFADMKSRPMGIGMDLEGRRKDGTTFPVEIALGAVETEEGKVAVSFIADITARKEAEAALRASELQYRSLFENMNEGIAYCRMIFEDGVGTDYVYLAVNPRFEALTHLKDVVGKRATEDLPRLRELDPDLLEVVARVARTGEPERLEMFLNIVGHWYSMSVYSPEADHFVVVFDNITEARRAGQALAESEERLRLAVESTGLGTFDVDVRTGEGIWSATTKRYFGLPSDAPVDQTAVSRAIPLDEYAGVHRVFAQAQQPGGPEHFSTEFRAIGIEDGVERWLAVSGRVIFDVEGQPTRLIGVVRDFTSRKRMEMALEASRDEIRALAASLLTAQEEERRRVSRELHDNTCQELAALAIEVGAMAQHPPPAERKRLLLAIQQRVVRASEQARHIAYELHPSMLDDLGLVASLKDLCRQFSDRAPDTELMFTGGALRSPVPVEVASCIYRIAQEGLRNIEQHAAARRVAVGLSTHKGNLVLKIADDGVGFDAAIMRGRGGLGLIGMQERARLVHGKFTVASKPGSGTRIAAEVPLHAGTAPAKRS